MNLGFWTGNSAQIFYAQVAQSRQCVGRRLRRVLMSALIQPPTTRRQGNEIRQTQSPLITASSRSRSNGAMEIGCHMKRTRRGRATQRQLGPSQYQRAHYTNVSMELLFSHPAFCQ